jgi:hypothetical protein
VEVHGVRSGAGHRRHGRGILRQVKVSDLEAEALKLDPADRARLAAKLLESLDALSEEENERLWVEEATRRDAELDTDPSRGRPAEDVFRDAKARLG